MTNTPEKTKSILGTKCVIMGRSGSEKQLFRAWAGCVRSKTYRDVQERIYVTGQTPEAIIVGGEYRLAFMDDYREIQRTPDGGLLWRGVPLIRGGPVDKVLVVWNMEALELPVWKESVLIRHGTSK